ncbi:type I 3-dehydroquinate dehydratase [Staphylococcus caprae]|uniref:type I 3-dehydroquinate dehydratase n=1 Tax=Staphylococcus caprae TaxID=29380 RepID=UPI001C82BBB9|nr:type I 3-dehydroquinate dehydratase [Staphylococcus caprae]MBX5320237.1 type I 3-dehydroquinate dehydratase [Staphylococcus caprae]MDI9231103.1 type I 3-dehydroquinate dehydratase [Staphylococcus caprae]
MTHVDVAATIAPENQISQTLLNDIYQYRDSIDIVELRIDQWFDFNMEQFETTIHQLKQLKLDFKILVTYRTSTQGGKGDIGETEYLELLYKLIQHAQFEMLDIEWNATIDVEVYGKLIQHAQENGLKVVLSHHNFQETPSLEELKFIYFKMQKLSPQYLKLAVMPHSKEDVLHLLEAMSVTSDSTSYQVIGISMSKLGVISRTAQGVFGGAVSYGCLGEPQAPGQIHVKELKQQLQFYES